MGLRVMIPVVGEVVTGKRAEEPQVGSEATTAPDAAVVEGEDLVDSPSPLIWSIGLVQCGPLLNRDRGGLIDGFLTVLDPSDSLGHSLVTDSEVPADCRIT